MGGRSDELQEGMRGRLGEGRTRVIKLYKGGCKGMEQNVCTCGHIQYTYIRMYIQRHNTPRLCSLFATAAAKRLSPPTLVHISLYSGPLHEVKSRQKASSLDTIKTLQTTHTQGFPHMCTYELDTVTK